jgi:hypothetical protein
MIKNRHLKTGDFCKYYDSTQKRNYWVLGYFGGGSVSVVDALELGKEYSDLTGVPLESVRIDEILQSTRYKGFKFIFSTVEQEKEPDVKNVDIMENVHAFLRR